MSWLLIALLPPMLFAASNYIDKYFIIRYFKRGGIGGFILFSAFLPIVPASLIFLFHPGILTVPLFDAALMIAAGILLIASLIPYFYALEQADASSVLPLFQMIPVFSYVLGLVFLGEQLTGIQLLSGLLIVAGSAGLSSRLASPRRSLSKQRIFLLMICASLLFALNGLLFKFVAIQSDFWSTSFWEYIGYLLAGIFCFLFLPTYRKQFLSLLHTNAPGIIGLNVVNECITIAGFLILHYATLLAPLALVSAVSGTHPFFVLLYGLILTLFFPKIIKENISRHVLFSKLGFIVLIFIGAVLLGENA